MNATVSDDAFPVCCEYGMGGLSAVLIAPSRGAIMSKYPGCSSPGAQPCWMPEERLARLRCGPLWLEDDPPTGFLSRRSTKVSQANGING
ncbi:MAG: hypothetical protein ABI468_09335 [Candidatus Nanopelagicales bacterium]